MSPGVTGSIRPTRAAVTERPGARAIARAAMASRGRRWPRGVVPRSLTISTTFRSGASDGEDPVPGKSISAPDPDRSAFDENRCATSRASSAAASGPLEDPLGEEPILGEDGEPRRRARVEAHDDLVGRVGRVERDARRPPRGHAVACRGRPRASFESPSAPPRADSSGRPPRRTGYVESGSRLTAGMRRDRKFSGELLIEERVQGCETHAPGSQRDGRSIYGI